MASQNRLLTVALAVLAVVSTVQAAGNKEKPSPAGSFEMRPTEGPKHVKASSKLETPQLHNRAERGRKLMGHATPMDGPNPTYEIPKPSPSGENDEAVDALFGYAGASCAYIQSQGVCEYPSEWGWDIFKKLCPVSCQNSGLDFCPGGDEDGWLLTYAYFLYGSPEEGTDAYDWVMGMYGNGCAKSPEIMAEGTPDQTMVWQYSTGGTPTWPCNNPAISLFCAETCKTNCWAWPAPRSQKVYLPSCGRHVDVPMAVHRRMAANEADPGGDGTAVCPPVQ